MRLVTRFREKRDIMQPPYEMCDFACDLQSVCYRHHAKPAKNQVYYEKSPMDKFYIEKGPIKGWHYLCEGFWRLEKNRSKHRKLSRQLEKADK